MPQEKKVSPGPRQARTSLARRTLIESLEKLFKQKAFSGHSLDHFLKTTQMEAVDRSLFTELFYGFLRYGHQLLYRVDSFLANPEHTALRVRRILAIAFYQKLYLNRIPDHALVNEAVEMTRACAGGEPLARVVNAVLRRFLAALAKGEAFANEPLFAQLSFPAWLVDRWVEQWGEHHFVTMAKALNARAPTFIRVNCLRGNAATLQGLFASAGVDCQTTALPGCLRLSQLADSPISLVGYTDGLWSIQNIASQQIAPLLDVQEGQDILDACAGFGGKTLQLAELTNDAACIYYNDVASEKLQTLALRARQMGFKSVKRAPLTKKEYDRILVDAPCSGLGSLASHPEIKWFRSAADLERYPEQQLAILKEQAPHLKHGGKLLYAVCSIDKAEGEDVIQQFLSADKNFVPDPDFSVASPNSAVGFYLYPTDTGGTGYYVARLVRNNHA